MTLNFNELSELIKGKSKKRIVVAAAEDLAVLKAIKEAAIHQIVTPIFVGDLVQIRKICLDINFDIQDFECISQTNPSLSSVLAVQYVKNGKADILMKGLVSTASLLKAVLDKETGIKETPLLSHVAVFQSPYYPKFLGITDAAMNISPSVDEKITIIENAVNVFHKLGIQCPKVAVVCPLETVNQKIESTVHASTLTAMNNSGQIKNCIIDGPLALDNAVSKEAAEHKGIQSEVAGDADIILTNDLDAGNILYKSLIFLGGAKSAAIICGAKVPIVLTSRADSEESKFYSIVLAALMC